MSTHYRCQEKVIWQKLHLCDFSVLLQAMQLHAIVVVDVDIFLLSSSKILVVVQPLDVANNFSQLSFAAQLAFSPIHGRNVTLLSAEQQVSSVSRVIKHIRAHIVEL